MRRSILFGGALFLIASCTTPDPAQVSSRPEVIQARALPVRLAPDSTWMPLDDHCPQGGVDSVTWIPAWGQGKTVPIVTHQGAAGVWIHEQPIAGLGALALSKGGWTAHVPVLASTERWVPFVFSPAGSPRDVRIMGAFNGWSRTSHPLALDAEGRWSIDLPLAEGKHAYQLIIDGQEGPDPNNPNRVDNGFGGFNSLLSVDGSGPAIALSAIGFGGNQVHDIRLLGTPGARVWAWWQNELYTSTLLGQDGAGLVRVPAAAYAAGRSDIRLWATGPGTPSHEVRIPLLDGLPLRDPKELIRQDWESQILYFMMVDRFRNGNPENDRPVDDPAIHPKANDHGGDLDGIQQALDEGYFDRLGVTALWVSPLTKNPNEAYGFWSDASTDTTSKFSGYHGYWPISNTAIDPRFGDQTTLDQLVASAHDKDMNFLLDYVANHVHEEHPIYKAHPEWATSLYLPDGRENTQLWDEQRLTTWFDTFLPTLDLQQPAVASAMSDSAAWWIANSDIDGFRHDATKHIPLSFWRMLTKKIKAETEGTPRRIYQIGETYGSAGLIASYLGTGLLDAQFDFNLYDKAIVAFGKDGSGTDDLVRVAQEGLNTYGAHHLMGTITGNQDRPRLASLAEGTVRWDEDHKLAGWTRNIQRKGMRGHMAMRMLTAFNLSMPGVPCIYQGDEYADVGGNDPDNRRMVRFADLTDAEADTRDHVQSWIQLRRNRMSMMFGQTQIEALPSGVLRIQRQYLDETTTVFINPTPTVQSVQVPGVLLLGSLVDNQLPAYGCLAASGS